MLPSDIRSLTEAYQSIYAPKEETIEITEELLDEAFDELVDEFIEEGYEEEEALAVLEEATDAYLDEAKVTFGSDTAPMRASGARVGARRRYGRRKAGEALKAAGEKAKSAADTVKKKAAGAVASAQIAGSIAKDEARRAGRAAQHSVTKAADAAKRAPGEAKKKAKSGIKGFIKRQAEKVVKRMSEEAIQEADSIAAMRERAAKRRKQRYGASDTSRGGRDDFRPYTKADYERGEANDPKKKVEEQLDIFDVVLEFLQAEGYAETLEEAEWMMANLIDEEAIDIILGEEQLDEVLTGERYKKVMKNPGGTAYSRKVSADPAKRATRGGRGGESDFGAGDRGSGNKAKRRSGKSVDDSRYEY